LTQRLSNIFVQYHILKGGNYAGLPGGSTFDPIHTINLIKEDAFRNNKEVWFLFQDLNKAYDRVNIQLLCKCMLRLKIPTSFINLVLNFFTKHTNAIITSDSITMPYQMKVGIDQGEVISPLLWTIYYDPLFCRIKNLQQKYVASLCRLTSIDPLQYEQLKVECNLLGYLDNTTWIASSKEELEHMLSEANSYYTFMNIKVNK